MPYIQDIGKRMDIREGLYLPDNVGELNFKITDACHTYLNQHGLSYKTINSVIGVLECAKLELYRQIASPYEDTKKRDNGNISELDSGCFTKEMLGENND